MKKLIIISLLFILSCNYFDRGKSNPIGNEIKGLEISEISVDTEANFRGLYFNKSNSVWISGSDKSIYFTEDSGLTWNKCETSDTTKVDYRDIEVINDVILVMTAGFPCKILRSENKGKNWETVYNNPDSSAFLDGMDFNSKGYGVAFGDPINDHVMILTTTDYGKTWEEVDKKSIPEKLEVEAGFAASGSGVQVFEDNSAIIGLGGTSARVLICDKMHGNWKAVETKISAGNSSRGIYSLAFRDHLNGVAVGGAWNEDSVECSINYTKDGGNTWNEVEEMGIYFSSVCSAGRNIFIAVGPSGIYSSSYDNNHWKKLSDEALHVISIDTNSGFGYGAGANGKVVRVVVKREFF